MAPYVALKFFTRWRSRCSNLIIIFMQGMSSYVFEMLYKVVWHTISVAQYAANRTRNIGQISFSTLKALYTFGNRRRVPVFSLGVSHHKHKITSLWKFGLKRSSKLRENDERKNTLVGRICVLSDRNKRLLARSLLLRNYLFLQRESFSHNVLYLSTALQCWLPSQFLS